MSIRKPESECNSLNIELNKFNIDCFQHRIIKRLAHFVHKIVNLKTSPVDLKEVLISNRSKKIDYNLINSNDYLVPSKGKLNDYGEKTLDYFYSKFINKLLIDNLHLDFVLFKR